jgi:hypothetical protein
MKRQLAMIAVLAAFVGCVTAISTTTAGARTRPALCEHSCGGSWGAYEHAKAFAEQHGFWQVYVGACWQTTEYGSQWRCSGGGIWGGGSNTWTVWMDAYGYEKHWTQTYA